jgi:undecaprenyl-phosphate galactose phosphotransferase
MSSSIAVHSEPASRHEPTSVFGELEHAEQVRKTSSARRRVPDWLDDALNRVAAALLLVLLSPVMLAVAVAIWWVDGAPVLFGHYRVGRNGRIFKCLKFRTMLRNSQEALAELLARDPEARAEWELDHKLSHDPRVTGIGALLRRTSLDELPQLFNVLRGEMALVGPRPITVQELTRYGRVRWHYLSVRPGMTGLWQVSGRNRVSYAGRVDLDRSYVEQRTVAMDVQILVRTVKVVTRAEGDRHDPRQP